MKKVIVIGGGVSGLVSAKRLVDSGKFEVKLLEADNRVGGRVYTRPFGDYHVENGAQWVHGEEGNAIFNLCNPLKLLDTDECDKEKFTSDSVFVTNVGRKLEGPEHEKVSLILGKILDGPEEDEVEGTVGDWANRKFQKEADTYSLDSMGKDLKDAVLDWIHRFQDNIDGADNWFQTSLRGQHEYWECEGNPTVAWKSPACYASLFSVILGNPPTIAPVFQPELPSWIETGKVVTKIELLSEQETVSVTCSDGSQYSADHVICTVSLGVLKHNHTTLFRPSLPEKKICAIENLGIGCMNKVHFDFKKRWWPDTVLGFSLLWEDSNVVEEYWRSDIDEATLRKEINGIPLWCRNILGFYRVSAHPTAMNSWISGPASVLMEKLSEEEVKTTFMKVLRMFVKGYEIPEPVEFCRSTWFSNPFTKGSYSFRQMESESKNVWASDLAEPVWSKSKSPVLCFAGEATQDHYYSTVHGAYESGIREADRLISGSKPETI